MEPAGGQLLGEELRLAQGHRLEGGDDDEGGPPVRQQAADRLGSLHEPVVHRLEEDEELGDVGEELGPEDPVGDLVEGLRGHVDQPRPVGDDQPPQQPRGEEVGHPLRRVEEVERVPGRRGVDDDEVVVARASGSRRAAPWRCSRGSGRTDRRCSGRAGWRGSRPASCASGAWWRMRASHDSLVSSMAAHSSPLGPQARGTEGLVGDAVLDVADAVEPERVGQPLGRVDGEHQHLGARGGPRP